MRKKVDEACIDRGGYKSPTAELKASRKDELPASLSTGLRTYLDG